MTVFRAACVQMRSSRDVAENVRVASGLIREARSAGADFIATPEYTTIMDEDRGHLRAQLHPDTGDNPTLRVFQDLSKELGCWLLIGGMPVLADGGRFFNRSCLIAPDGGVAARYDKIHMFDVVVSEQEQYRESANFEPGTRAVVASLPWGKLGMTICYDLRFPDLYRALSKAGASVLAVPSAFTRVTGQAHWHVLLRARAIETGCFVIAPAQGGKHESGRETFGHSLIVDPWGRVLAEGGGEPGVVMAEIDVDEVAKARGRIPSLGLTVELGPVQLS